MPRLNTANTRRWIWIAALAAPMATVQLVRLLADGGPQAASAAPLEAAPEAAPAPRAPTPLTEVQRRALGMLKGYRPSESLVSPMDRPDPAPPTPTEPAPAPEAVADAPDPLLGVTVTAIFGQGHDASAIIAHKLRRVGDEVAPGWRVQQIDPRLRTVELTGAEGRTVVLTPPSK